MIREKRGCGREAAGDISVRGPATAVGAPRSGWLSVLTALTNGGVQYMCVLAPAPKPLLPRPRTLSEGIAVDACRIAQYERACGDRLRAPGLCDVLTVAHDF